jgi:hypothetical protein
MADLGYKITDQYAMYFLTFTVARYPKSKPKLPTTKLIEVHPLS